MSGFYWIASYPKSGNTWVRLTLDSLLSGGKSPDFTKPSNIISIAGARSDIDRYLDIESSDLLPHELEEARAELPFLIAQQSSVPLFRKTHDCWRLTHTGKPLFPPQITLASIYLVRDPRDIACSYAHHSDVEIDETIDFMADPNATVSRSIYSLREQAPMRLTTWSMHVNSWLTATPAPLVLRYEDMVTEPEHAFQKMVSHLDLSYSLEEINISVNKTKFDLLKEQENKNGFSLVETINRKPFFRQGFSGGWRNILTPKQIDKIIKNHGEVMSKMGYI